MTISKPSPTNLIALIILTQAVGLTIFAFIAGRQNPTTATAVILCVTNTVSTLLGIGGGLLGQQVLSGRGAATDYPPPPGSVATTTDKLEIPPLAPNPEA